MARNKRIRSVGDKTPVREKQNKKEQQNQIVNLVTGVVTEKQIDFHFHFKIFF